MEEPKGIAETVGKLSEIIQIQTDVIDLLAMLLLQNYEIDDDTLGKIKMAADLQDSARLGGILTA